jgi:PiT family inorganic phosphate transporter
MTLQAAGLVAAACVYGIGSGFNDGGNLLASFTSGRLISPRAALALLVFVPLGAVLIGSEVARTVGVSIIDMPAQGVTGFIVVVAVSLMVVWLSWRLVIPTSMTLALVGAMLGWAIVGGGGGVRWSGAGRVLVAMPLSILAGGALGLAIFSVARRMLGRMAYRKVLRLARGQYIAAALQAFAYGANDLGKTVGLIAIAVALTSSGPPRFSAALPIAGAALSFFAGTVLGGWSLAQRIGFGVVKLRPIQAMSAQIGAGAVVAALAGFGAPVSTTQTIDGGLVGVGLSVRASAIRWGIVREMAASWAVTLPLALLLAAIVHIVTRTIGIS